PGFYASTAALPARLPGGQHRQLVRIEEISYCASGQIDLDEELFLAVCDWPEFLRRSAEGRIVSQSRTFDRLAKLAPSLELPEVEKVTLASVIAWELDAHGSLIAPALADQMGEVVTEDLLAKLETGTWSDQAEAAGIHATLDDANFIARD